MSFVGNVLERLGFTFGQVIIGDVSLRNVFFSPWTSSKNFTTEPIDGDQNTDIDTYSKIEQQKYVVTGFLQNLLAISNRHKNDFETLNKYFKENKPFKFIGTDFDDRFFIMSSITKNDEGFNYITFTLEVKELNLAQVKEFTTESRNIPQTAVSEKAGNTAKKKIVNIPLTNY